MAFAVVHMQKIKAGGIRGIQSHIHREHKPRTNPDIDVSRTHENYDVLCCRNFVQQIKETIKNFAPKRGYLENSLPRPLLNDASIKKA